MLITTGLFKNLMHRKKFFNSNVSFCTHNRHKL